MTYIPKTTWMQEFYTPAQTDYCGVIPYRRGNISKYGDIRIHILNCMHGGFDRGSEFAEGTEWSILTIRAAIKELVDNGIIRRVRIKATVGNAMRYEFAEAQNENT